MIKFGIIIEFDLICQNGIPTLSLTIVGKKQKINKIGNFYASRLVDLNSIYIYIIDCPR